LLGAAPLVATWRPTCCSCPGTSVAAQSVPRQVSTPALGAQVIPQALTTPVAAASGQEICHPVRAVVLLTVSWAT
jgi:hypothetical protein